MLYQYGYYIIASDDLPLPPLVALENQNVKANIIIRRYPESLSIRDTAAWLHHYDNSDGRAFLSIGRVQGGYVVSFPALAVFLVSIDDLTIHFFSEPETREYTLIHLLLDQVIPRMLSMMGQIVIHAGAVDVGGKAVVFLGKSGRGKSTLVTYFDKSGYMCLTDDAFLLIEKQSQFYTMLTYPGLRLWPESAKTLLGQDNSLSRVAQYHPKERHRTTFSGQMNERTMPIQAVYELAEPRPEVAGVVVSALSPQRSVIELIESSFRLDWSEKAVLDTELDMFTRLVEQVPFFQITYPRNFTFLPQVQAAILAAL